MNSEILKIIEFTNPWLYVDTVFPLSTSTFTPRIQVEELLSPEWDNLWLILTGPRQAGKTTLAKFVAQSLIKAKRFENLIYLNCDFLEIRQFLHSPLFINEILKEFHLTNPIFFIDEVQRIENPGLLLKGIADLKLPIKMIASGSSQIELKSSIQEFLTGRQLEVLVLPFSYRELKEIKEEFLVYGLYPAVVLGKQKNILLQQLYNDYINKDIIEILKVGKPDVMRKLIRLLAHSSGQLVNYNQLATDCRVSIPTIQHYCSILESTYVISSIKPFVGNKRKEIVSNPIYYFIDNGFRNESLREFSGINDRGDTGLLIQSAVFQEILKFRTQNFNYFDIFYWRTQSGAEVDFVIYYNDNRIVPIESKFRNLKRPTVPKGLRSFISAYTPKHAIIITKNFKTVIHIENCAVHFIPFQNLIDLFPILKET